MTVNTKILLFVLFIFLNIFSYSQEYNLSLNICSGISNNFLFQKDVHLTKRDIGIGGKIGINNYLDFNNYSIGIGIETKFIKNQYYISEPVETFKYFNIIDFSIFFQKHFTKFICSIGLENNISIQGIKIKETFVGSRFEYPVYIAAIFTQFEYPLNNNINLNLYMYTDISPIQKICYSNTLVALFLSNGIFVGLNYNFLK